MRSALAILAVACLCAALASCASGRERQAFRDYRELEAVTYGAPSRHPPRPPLPLLTAESTLQDYLRYAALNNPGLEAAFNRWKAAIERIPQARSLPDPRFAYGWFIEAVETRVGPQRNRFGWYQTFPWIHRLMLQGGMAAEAAAAERKRFDAQKLRLFYRVKDAYYEYYYVARAIAVTGENAKLLKDFEEIARRKYRVGTAAHPDVIRAQVELGKIEDRLRSLEDLRGPVVARLNAALNRPVGMPLPEPSTVPEEKIEAGDDQLIAWMREGNPELAAMDFDIEKERKGVSLAKEWFIPDVTLGLDWIQTDRAPMVTSDNGKDPIIANVSVNLPVWYDKYKAAEREAQARFIAAQRARLDMENRLAYDLKMALYNYRDAERKIDLYGRTLMQKGEESLRATETAYRAGNIDFLNLIDAQRILIEFQLSYERALADRAQRFAELEMLVGREAPGGEIPADEGGGGGMD
ncbi:MAG: TolC family protein [bacterium]|nr:TolC family protein [bacterium]